MNILFIHEVDWLKKVVFEIHSTAESLSLLGHRVFAIDYENAWKRDGFFDFGSLRTKEFNGISRAYSGASVSLRRPGFIKIPVLSRLSAGFTHYLEIRRTIREKNIDAIILYSAPTNGLQTVHWARQFRIPVVFRSIDILNQLVPYPVLRPMVRLLEKRVYSGVDRVLTITPKLSEYVVRLGADPNRVDVLPLPVDTELFHPSDDTKELRRKWGLGEGDRVILYMGTLFDFSGLDGFLSRFGVVVEQIPEARLLIVGDGPQRSRLERIITELKLEKKVIITGFQPYQTMPQYINLADVCMNTFAVTDATRDIFPGKMIQYMACGRATVATPLPGLKALIPGESQGMVYASSADEMAEVMVSLLKSPERRQQLGQAALDYVKRNHDYKVIARQLENVLKDIIKEKRNETGKPVQG